MVTKNHSYYGIYSKVPIAVQQRSGSREKVLQITVTVKLSCLCGASQREALHRPD